MSSTAIALVLAAAVAHASWNLFSKQAAATGAACFLWLLAAWAAVLYSPLAGYALWTSYPHLTTMNWVFLAGTGFLHSGYFLFLQLGYRLGDLSVAYPISRGTGAMLATIAGIVLLGERPSWVAAAGVVTIVAGVVVIGLPSRQPQPAAIQPAAIQPATQPPAGQPLATGPTSTGPTSTGPTSTGPTSTGPTSTGPTSTGPTSTGPISTAPAAGPGTGQTAASPADRGHANLTVLTYALVTGLFIACYTIWDKYAVATLHTPPVLQGCVEFPAMALVFAPFVLRDTAQLADVWRTFRMQVIGAAVLSPLAYILVLVALSFTAVSAVAPAREVSVLFGVLLGRRLLGEGSVARRLAAGAAIVAGIIAIAIG